MARRYAVSNGTGYSKLSIAPETMAKREFGEPREPRRTPLEDPSGSSDEDSSNPRSLRVRQPFTKAYIADQRLQAERNRERQRSLERRIDSQSYPNLLAQAKKIDQSAIDYAQRKVKNSADYQAASPSRQAQLLGEIEHATVKERTRNGMHHSILEEKHARDIELGIVSPDTPTSNAADGDVKVGRHVSLEPFTSKGQDEDSDGEGANQTVRMGRHQENGPSGEAAQASGSEDDTADGEDDKYCRQPISEEELRAILDTEEKEELDDSELDDGELDDSD